MISLFVSSIKLNQKKKIDNEKVFHLIHISPQPGENFPQIICTWFKYIPFSSLTIQGTLKWLSLMVGGKKHETSLCIPGIDQLKVVSNLVETEKLGLIKRKLSERNHRHANRSLCSSVRYSYFHFPRLGTKAVTSVLGEWIRKKVNGSKI